MYILFMDVPGFNSQKGQWWNFSLHHRIQTGSVAHPTSYPMGTGGSFPGGKAAAVGEADPLTWSYTSTSQYVVLN
jgi:hypothetical protein